MVVFNTTRTLVNFSKSTIDILHKSVWPEISISYGKGDLFKLRQIHYRTIGYSILLAIITTLILFFCGDFLYTIWTKGTVKFDLILFTLLLLALVTNTIWSSSAVLLQATNNHKNFSLFYLFAAILIFVTSLLLLTTIKQVQYIPISMLFVDILLIGYVIKKALRITEDSFSHFFAGTVISVRTFFKSFPTTFSSFIK